MVSSGEQLHHSVATASAWWKRTRLAHFGGQDVVGLPSNYWGLRWAADTHIGGNGNRPPTRTLGRTTDGSTDGVATEGVARWGGQSEEPHILGNGARGQARTGVKCVGRPTLSWKDHQQKMEG